MGSGEFLLWEFPLSYWIEQQGYDVSYISNVDTHMDAPGLQRAKVSSRWATTNIGRGRCTTMLVPPVMPASTLHS